ncbi:MAG: diaminopimelate decarboxylase [Labilithrix sp.]|nr:diaminopimelate decarboxylase [Labilithrix sp.]MCW5818047.1 diaminopimelate decarboxylase [Labilithrix sp.]
MTATRRDAQGVLTLGGVSLAGLGRYEGIGTPTYVYDLDGIAANAKALEAAFEGESHLVAYAVKANSAGPIVRTLAAEGCGADVVSGPELVLAQRCGIAAEKIIYSGVAKADDELDLAIGMGERGIRAINVESVEEIVRVAARAKALGRVARVTMRINPGVEEDVIDTHRHITTGHDDAKFGIPLSTLNDAVGAALAAPAQVRVVGIAAHAGSQLTAMESYLASARKVFETAKELRGRFALELVDTGGGFGIDYGEGCPVTPADFIRAVRAAKREAGLDDLAFFCEPGRSLVGAQGILLARVIQVKVAPERRWLMIDAGMNDLMRPALYQAFHRIVPVTMPAGATPVPMRVVGPVCESSDDFGVHELPSQPFEDVAILDAGAYGFSMASRYNGRAVPAEMFLAGGKVREVRARKPATDWVDDRM